jgi:hypothetical protein
MRTYHLTPELPLPLLSVRKVPNRDIGFHGSLDSGCDVKETRHQMVGNVQQWKVMN